MSRALLIGTMAAEVATSAVSWCLEQAVPGSILASAMLIAGILPAAYRLTDSCLTRLMGWDHTDSLSVG